jgi:hypothetical protein
MSLEKIITSEPVHTSLVYFHLQIDILFVLNKLIGVLPGCGKKQPQTKGTKRMLKSGLFFVWFIVIFEVSSFNCTTCWMNIGRMVEIFQIPQLNLSFENLSHLLTQCFQAYMVQVEYLILQGMYISYQEELIALNSTNASFSILKLPNLKAVHSIPMLCSCLI